MAPVKSSLNFSGSSKDLAEAFSKGAKKGGLKVNMATFSMLPAIPKSKGTVLKWLQDDSKWGAQ